MPALKAHVVNGRIELDDPMQLPEGAEVDVHVADVMDAEMSAREREALEQSIERGIAEADAGSLVDADAVLAELSRA